MSVSMAGNWDLLERYETSPFKLETNHFLTPLPASHSSRSGRGHQYNLRANSRRSVFSAVLLSSPCHTDARISEIVRAARILKRMQRAHEAEIGAIGLDGQMIDAPMIKQVIVICRLVKSTTSSAQTDEF